MFEVLNLMHYPHQLRLCRSPLHFPTGEVDSVDPLSLPPQYSSPNFNNISRASEISFKLDDTKKINLTTEPNPASFFGIKDDDYPVGRDRRELSYGFP